MRYLFVAPPYLSHVRRLARDADELAARGHEVAWLGYRDVVRGERAARAVAVEPLPDRVAERLLTAHRRRARTHPFGPGVTAAVFEDVLLPLTRAELPLVAAALERVRPDCVVADVFSLAASLVARQRNLVWATSCQPADALAELTAVAPIRDFLDRRLGPLQRAVGLAPVARPMLSPHLVLVPAVRELIGDVELVSAAQLLGVTVERAAEARERGPCRGDRHGVYVSLGTNVDEAGVAFLRSAATALAGEPLDVVIVAPPGAVPDPPPNVTVSGFVPQIALLGRVAAVVSHGGYGTVVESLVHGRPLVLAPITYDQPFNAACVVAAGAGIRLKTRRVTPAAIRTAVNRVLGEPSFACAARRVGEALERAGGSRTAAAALERLAGAGT